MLNNRFNYIFDLDGTLINSSSEVINCFKLAFEAANIKYDESLFTSDVIGPPIREIISLLSPGIEEENALEIIKNFRQIYDYDQNDISVMYDGIYKILCDLKEQRDRLFIATFKPAVPTIRLVDKFKLKEIFDDIYTIDKFGRKITKEEMISGIISAYNLEKSKTVMIGDAVSDMTSAHNAGIKGIGVLWGYGSDKEPLKNAADYVVKNAEELIECLKLNYRTI